MVFYDKRGGDEIVYCIMEDGEILKVSVFVILVFCFL